MKSRREQEPVPLGVLEEQVMLAVLRTGDDAYGMQVRREMEEVTGRDSPSARSTRRSIGWRRRASSARRVPTARTAFASRVCRDAPGARSLALTRATRERLWSGVKLQRVADT